MIAIGVVLLLVPSALMYLLLTAMKERLSALIVTGVALIGSGFGYAMAVTSHGGSSNIYFGPIMNVILASGFLGFSSGALLFHLVPVAKNRRLIFGILSVLAGAGLWTLYRQNFF